MDTHKMKELLKGAVPLPHHRRHEDGSNPFPFAHGQVQQQVSQKDVPSKIKSPTPLEVLQYRYHYGANLGSIFVLEQWLFPSMFPPSATGGAELDAVTASLATSGVEATAQKWAAHYSTALSDSDITHLAHTLHCTTIRLPIGYFTLGPAYTASTPFAPSAPVYASAWPAVTALCARLHAAGIATLVDFHALPGGANPDPHSGTSSHAAALWSSPANLALATRCLLFIAGRVAADALPGCVGIQLCNEAAASSPGIYAWYADVLAALSAVSPSTPLYISDAWDLPTALDWAAARNSPATVQSSCPVIVDTHRYYCFDAADTAQSPAALIAALPSALSEIPPRTGTVVATGAAQCVVGEYSCVLAPSSWAQAPAAQQPALEQAFGRAQLAAWRARSAGSFFWTARMDWMGGQQWGFYDMAAASAIPPPAYLALPFGAVADRLAAANAAKAARAAAAAAAHASYWDRVSPGGYFEHWRYGDGYAVGYEDAVAFFGMRAGGGVVGAQSGGDRIGALEVWVRRRIGESGGAGGYLWEWEQGFRQGVGDAEAVLLAGL